MEKSTKPLENAERPVQSEYIRIVSASVLAPPMRSPTAPKISPPVAQPATKMEVATPPYQIGSLPGASSAFMAEPRARRKSCWSRQSKSQASEAIAKTNQWYFERPLYQGVLGRTS